MLIKFGCACFRILSVSLPELTLEDVWSKWLRQMFRQISRFQCMSESRILDLQESPEHVSILICLMVVNWKEVWSLPPIWVLGASKYRQAFSNVTLFSPFLKEKYKTIAFYSSVRKRLNFYLIFLRTASFPWFECCVPPVTTHSTLHPRHHILLRFNWPRLAATYQTPAVSRSKNGVPR